MSNCTISFVSNSTCWLLGKQRGNVHIIPDATPVSNPAEDTMQLLAYLYTPDVGMVLPCMVLCRGPPWKLSKFSILREIRMGCTEGGVATHTDMTV